MFNTILYLEYKPSMVIVWMSIQLPWGLPALPCSTFCLFFLWLICFSQICIPRLWNMDSKPETLKMLQIWWFSCSRWNWPKVWVTNGLKIDFLLRNRSKLLSRRSISLQWMVPDKIGAAYQLSGMVPYQIIIGILQGFYKIIAIRIFLLKAGLMS